MGRESRRGDSGRVGWVMEPRCIHSTITTLWMGFAALVFDAPELCSLIIIFHTHTMEPPILLFCVQFLKIPMLPNSQNFSCGKRGIFQCFNHILRIRSSKGHEEVSAFTHVFLQWKWKRPEIQPSAKGNLALGRNNFGWWPINWPGGYNQVIPSTLATTQYVTVQYNKIHQIRIQYNLIQYFRLECHPSEFVKSQ